MRPTASSAASKSFTGTIPNPLQTAHWVHLRHLRRLHGCHNMMITCRLYPARCYAVQHLLCCTHKPTHAASPRHHSQPSTPQTLHNRSRSTHSCNITHVCSTQDVDAVTSEQPALPLCLCLLLRLHLPCKLLEVKPTRQGGLVGRLGVSQQRLWFGVLACVLRVWRAAAGTERVGD